MKIGLLHNFFRFKKHISLEVIYIILDYLLKDEDDYVIINFPKEIDRYNGYYKTEADINELGWEKLQVSYEMDGILNHKLLEVDIVIGFELSPSICDWINRHGLTYINFYTNPLRFLPDLLWSVVTNSSAIEQRLKEWNVDLGEYVSKAVLDVNIMTAKKQLEQRCLIKENTVVIFGQTDNDSSVLVDGEFKKLGDYISTLEKSVSDSEDILIVPHPMASSHVDLINVILKLGKGKLCNFNSYSLLCNENVSKIVTLSSSVGEEGHFFGKKAEYLIGPALRPGGAMIPENHNVYTVGQEMLHKEFWLNILSGDDAEKGATWTFDRTDYFRKIFGSWGMDRLTKFEPSSLYMFGYIGENERKQNGELGIRTLSMNAPVEIDFSNAIGLKTWNGSGLDYDGAGGVWTKNKKARLIFPGYEFLESGSIELVVHPYVNKKNRVQRVDFILNNKEMSTVSLDSDEDYVIKIPCSELKGENIELSLYMNDAISPYDCGLGADIRPLGINIKKCTLKGENIEDFVVKKRKNNSETVDCSPKQLLLGLINPDNIDNKYESWKSDGVQNMKQQDIKIKNESKKIGALENELNEIKSSRGWKLLQILWKIRDWIIPMNSKRRLFLKLAYKTIRHPRLMLEKLSVENVRKLFRYMKAESVEDLNARLALHLPTEYEYSEQLSLIPFREIAAEDVEEYEHITFSMWESVDVSIIIPVYNQFDYTYNCLQSIISNTKDVSYEIIIADDVSTDFTKDISKIIENIQVVRNENNLGFLRNCNNAVKSAKGKYILFLNNDTQVQPNWLKPLVDVLEKNPDIGMTGSKLVYPNGILQEAGGVFWRDGSAWNYGHGQNPNRPEFNYVKDVDYISGASLMIRRELWEKIGGFDEDFAPAYCEDSDLAFSVRQHGYRVVYQPKSVVVHFEGISNGKDLNKGIKSYQLENQKKLFEKWKNVLQTEHFDHGEELFFARDRSRGKKTIVVIDHYVPHYDQDAGGRTTWHYLNFLVQLGFHVIFVGDNYFPHEPYTSQLQQLGIEVLAGDGWNLKRFKSWVTENCKYINVVLLNRPHISIKYIDLFKQRTNAKIIYYGHDLHFIREQRQYEIEHDKSLLSSAEKWKKIECELVDKADIIYTPGNYEEVVLHKMFPEKRVQAIPIYLYETRELDSMMIPRVSARSDLLFVGGFGHKPNEDAVKWLITEIYPLILNIHPDTKLYIVGSHPTEYIKSLASEKIIVTGYVSDEELERYYQNARVAVVPLRYGAGIKGKIVEAIAHGLPTVTTPIGAEGLLDVDECVEIAEVGDANDYAEKTLKLLSDDTLWEKESKAEQKYIREHFTTECAKKILLDDLKL